MMDQNNKNNGPKCNSFGYTQHLVGLQTQNCSLFITDVARQFSRKEQNIKCASLRLEHDAKSNNVAKFAELNSEDQK